MSASLAIDKIKMRVNSMKNCGVTRIQRNTSQTRNHVSRTRVQLNQSQADLRGETEYIMDEIRKNIKRLAPRSWSTASILSCSAASGLSGHKNLSMPHWMEEPPILPSTDEPSMNLRRLPVKLSMPAVECQDKRSRLRSRDSTTWCCTPMGMPMWPRMVLPVCVVQAHSFAVNAVPI